MFEEERGGGVVHDATCVRGRREGGMRGWAGRAEGETAERVRVRVRVRG